MKTKFYVRYGDNIGTYNRYSKVMLLRMHGPIAHKGTPITNKPGLIECKLDVHQIRRFYTRAGSGLAGQVKKNQYVSETLETGLEIGLPKVPDVDVNDPDTL